MRSVCQLTRHMIDDRGGRATGSGRNHRPVLRADAPRVGDPPSWGASRLYHRGAGARERGAAEHRHHRFRSPRAPQLVTPDIVRLRPVHVLVVRARLADLGRIRCWWVDRRRTCPERGADARPAALARGGVAPARHPSTYFRPLPARPGPDAPPRKARQAGTDDDRHTASRSALARPPAAAVDSARTGGDGACADHVPFISGAQRDRNRKKERGR